MLILRLLRKLLRLRPPRRLRTRVFLWIARTIMLEFSWQLAVAAALAAVLIAVIAGTGSALALAAIAALVASAGVLLFLAWQALRSAAGVRAVLDELEDREDRDGPRFPASHIAFPPLMFLPRGVRHVRRVEYAANGGRPLLLDVYVPRQTAPGDDLRPALIEVHGGGWFVGSRSEQGIPLLNHLARAGWVGFNIDYRLSPRATWPAHVVDVKRAIAWVREHGAEYGANPEFICLTGGSAGGHLTALAALTAGDPVFQPGFEDADTSVAAAVPFYGVYDFTNADGVYYPQFRDWLLERVVIKVPYAERPDLYEAASPSHRVHSGAPPFLIIHGDWDSLVPVEDARAFVRRLRAVSEQPVLYAELQGAEHAFDLAPTVRSARVVETIERFLDEIRARSPEAAAPATLR